MNHLFRLMIDLAVDPQQREAFEENSSGMIQALGLSEENRRRLKSGNRAQIDAAFREDLRTDEFVSVMGSCIVLDPGPDPTPDPDPEPEPQ